ncbi:MAG: hypothetical protein IJI38_01310, partial [Clostridia bacterium]|nr:hypothetical protein [Clostridia bacterium]
MYESADLRSFFEPNRSATVVTGQHDKTSSAKEQMPLSALLVWNHLTYNKACFKKQKKTCLARKS